MFIAAQGVSDSSRAYVVLHGYDEVLSMIRSVYTRVCAALISAMVVVMPAAAQSIRSVDPNAVLTVPSAPTPPRGDDVNGDLAPVDGAMSVTPDPSSTANPAIATSPAATPSSTFKRDDVIGAAEGVFGKGAQGLASIIEKVLKDQGEPNAYIAGREVSGAFFVGLRYGSGTLKHNVEGERPVYWTGPSVGFDVGGDATKTFVLVYNLYDSQDLYKRYPEAEGRAYFVGGFSATYLRRGTVVLIPVRLGVGVRLGANIGYMKFSEKSKWLPF
jgi:hypothetical protein